MTTNIEQLLGTVLSEAEKVIDFRYQHELEELKSYIGDWDGTKYNTQHYVKINGEDWYNAYLYSAARTIQNIRDRVEDCFQGGTSNMIRGTILGMLLEICCANQFQTNWDNEIHLTKTNKYDMIIKGYKIDTKICMPHNNDKLEIVIADSKKLGQSDYFFFGKLLSNTTMNIFGWVPESEIISDSNKKQGRTGKWLPKEKLHKFNNIGVK